MIIRPRRQKLDKYPKIFEEKSKYNDFSLILQENHMLFSVCLHLVEDRFWTQQKARG